MWREYNSERRREVLITFLLVVCPGGSAAAVAAAAHANPFQVSQPAPPTLNQMRVSPMPSGFGAADAASLPPGMGMSLPQPLMSMQPQAGGAAAGGTTNPFLL